MDTLCTIVGTVCLCESLECCESRAERCTEFHQFEQHDDRFVTFQSPTKTKLQYKRKILCNSGTHLIHAQVVLMENCQCSENVEK